MRSPVDHTHQVSKKKPHPQGAGSSHSPSDEAGLAHSIVSNKNNLKDMVIRDSRAFSKGYRQRRKREREGRTKNGGKRGWKEDKDSNNINSPPKYETLNNLVK